jgi:hypothetical protein
MTYPAGQWVIAQEFDHFVGHYPAVVGCVHHFFHYFWLS